MKVRAHARSSSGRRRFAAALLLALAAGPAGAAGGWLFPAKLAGPVSTLHLATGPGRVQALTGGERWRDMDPDPCPDGRIVFASNRGRPGPVDPRRPVENVDIFIVRPGAPPRRLAGAAGDDVQPRCAPDGRHVAYVHRGGEREALHLVRLEDGADSLRLELERLYDLAWLPDGRGLVLAARRAGQGVLLRYSLETDSAEPLYGVPPDAPPAEPAAVSVSPDGQHLAFILHPLYAGGVRKAWILPHDGGAPRPISPENVQVQAPLTWSPDGRSLLYAAALDYDYEFDEVHHKKTYRGAVNLYLSPLSGATRCLTVGGLHRSPVFFPDGRRIAFLYADRLDARTLELRVMNKDGNDVKPWYDRVAPHALLRWYRYEHKNTSANLP